MNDVAISKLSARGSVIFIVVTGLMMATTNPREFLSTFGWRFIAKGIALTVVAPLLACVWQAYVGGPWYGLPLGLVLLYAAVLWGLFMQATCAEAERNARYFKDAWTRATESWQACEQRVHDLKHPPPPPADPNQLALALPDVKQPFRRARVMHVDLDL